MADTEILPVSKESIFAEGERLICNYACQHCDIIFESIENITGHLLGEHQIFVDPVGCKEGEEEEDSIVSNTKNFVIIRYSASEVYISRQFRWISSRKDGRFMPPNIEKKSADKKTGGHKSGNFPQQASKLGESKGRSPVRLKLDNRTKKEISNSLSLVHEGHQIKLDQVDQDTISNHSPSEDQNHSYPVGYTPSHKAGKGRAILHSPLRRFPCPYKGCDFVAKYKSNLNDHKKVHRGEKNFVCIWPGCHMKFIQGSQLRIHERTHTKEKPHKCIWPGCESAFSQNSQLRTHMLVHIDERSHACDYPGCNQTFRLKGALTKHKRTIHESLNVKK